jgi:hypothetical protein
MGDIVMRVRVSIGWLMGVVLMIALDLGFTRWALTAANEYGTLALVALPMSAPMLNVLTIVGVMMIRDLLRRGECGPFLSGFFVSGVGALSLVTTALMVFPEPILTPVQGVMETVIEFLNKSISGEMIWVLVMMVASLVFALPQLLVAIIGGLLNRRFGGFMIVTVRRHGQLEM